MWVKQTSGEKIGEQWNKHNQRSKLCPLHPSCLAFVQYIVSLTAELSRQLEEGDLVDHCYWKEGKAEGHLDTVEIWTGRLTEQEGTLGDWCKTMYCLLNCCLMKKNMLMENSWIFKDKLPEEEIHFTASLLFKS